MAERNMCSVAMRDTVVLPGSKSTSRAMDRVGTWDTSCPAAVVRVGGPHREGEEP